ncbi:MAG: TldD/PmbA family protein [Bacilli bacterium]|nr:TldD/PmbA family protein [Bacilli bacterium]
MEYKNFFEEAKKKNITNIQIAEKKTSESSVEIINGRMESYDDGNNISYSIKAEYNGKTVSVNSNYLNSNIIDLLILKAKVTDSLYEDDYLKNKERIPENKPLKFDISNEIKKLKELAKIREEYPEVEKMSFYFSESYNNTRIINSNGIDISTASHICYFSAEAVVKNNNNFTSYDKKVLETSKEKINFEKIIRDVAEKAIIQSNKNKISTGKYTILLDSNTAGRIISNLVNMISATNIRNKVSCLENKLNQKVFSQKLTIVEDPTNNKYPGYQLFDNEGTETRKKTIVDHGKLETFLYDIKESKIKGISPTGNSFRGISTRNMYVVPGEKSDQELIKSIENGIYIVDYMGSMGTSINTVTGAISIQIFGFLIKNGEIVCGINPAVMTTTIFELLNNIEEIASELEFTSLSSASPALLIKDISIAS